MDVTYIHHSGFLVETQRFYYLFDYETGILPPMDVKKPIFVLSSHSHADHCNPEIFPLLSGLGMEKIRAILSDDIEIPEGVDSLHVSPEAEYDLGYSLFCDYEYTYEDKIVDGEIHTVKSYVCENCNMEFIYDEYIKNAEVFGLWRLTVDGEVKYELECAYK